MTPTDLVLSYGDLIRQSGYRTRVLGEALHLERDSQLEPFLLAFDRDANRASPGEPWNIPHRFLTRHGSLFYPAMARLSRERAIRVVHAHNLYSAALALSTRRLWKYKVILDLHGRIPEEYSNLGKGGPVAKKLLDALEWWAVTRSDHVVAVSEQLRDYLRARYQVSDARITVVPCCTDGSRFNWSRARRSAERDRMGFSERFVCLHLGGFGDWYEPDVIVGTFKRLQKQIPNAHLVVATGELAAAKTCLADRLAPDAYTLTQVSHHEVPALLNAADIGFLLLPDLTNIKVSSPTKFAEYLNCGLPVLISRGVGDFSEMVSNHRVGHVLDGGPGGDGPSDAFLEELVANREEYAERAVEAGRVLLWQEHRENWNRIIGELLSPSQPSR